MLLNARMPKSLSFTRNTGVSSTRIGDSNKQSKISSLNETEVNISNLKISSPETGVQKNTFIASEDEVNAEDETNDEWTMQEIEEFISSGLPPQRSISSKQLTEKISPNLAIDDTNSIIAVATSNSDGSVHCPFTTDKDHDFKADLLGFVTHINPSSDSDCSLVGVSTSNTPFDDHTDEDVNTSAADLVDADYRDSDSGFADWSQDLNGISKRLTKSELESTLYSPLLSSDVFPSLTQSELYVQSLRGFHSPHIYFPLELGKPEKSSEDGIRRVDGGIDGSVIITTPDSDSPVSLSKRTSPIHFDASTVNLRGNSLEDFDNKNFSVVRNRKSRSTVNSAEKTPEKIIAKFSNSLESTNISTSYDNADTLLLKLQNKNDIDKNLSHCSRKLIIDQTIYDVAISNQESGDYICCLDDNLMYEFCGDLKSQEAEWNLVKGGKKEKSTD